MTPSPTSVEVRALAERLREGVNGQEAAYELRREAADMLDRLAQREDVIEELSDCLPPNAYDFSSVYEECARVCDLHAESNEMYVKKANDSEFSAARLTARAGALRIAASAIRSLAAQREDVIDREAVARIIDPNVFDKDPQAIWTAHDGWRKEQALAKADAIRSLTAQPNSNRVEDGAEDHSTCMDGSESNDGANAKSGIAK